MASTKTADKAPKNTADKAPKKKAEKAPKRVVTHPDPRRKSLYVFVTSVTELAHGSNNRGTSSGNNSHLQKVVLNGRTHTTVSAEAVRYAIRNGLTDQGIKLNRFVDPKTGAYEFEETDRRGNVGKYIDDDLLGFLVAKPPAKKDKKGDQPAAADAQEVPAAEDEVEAAEGDQQEVADDEDTRDARCQGRRGAVSTSRMISLRPWTGEFTFNSPGSRKEKGGGIYSAETHTTEYQGTQAVNTADVAHTGHLAPFLRTVASLPPVAGNHSRFSRDFSPESIAIRVTPDPASRIHHCFDCDEETGAMGVGKLLYRIRSGDIDKREMIVGGRIAETADGAALRELGVAVFPGVKAAMDHAIKQIAEHGVELNPA